MLSPLLSIQNLKIDFTNAEGEITHAINDISFDINKGEIVALVGESGSGKSVTSLSILNLLPKNSTIYTNGKILISTRTVTYNILSSSVRNMQQLRGNTIAMIFQEPMSCLNPVLTCGEQVLETILQHRKISRKEAKKHTIALFEKVQLPSPEVIYYKYPHQLSGGQKQRIMIAMAISCQPDLLICDEPTTALDVTIQKTILNLIKHIQKETNMAVLFISHDLTVVSAIADKIAVMYQGKIIEMDSASQLFKHPHHPYTKTLINCKKWLRSKHISLSPIDIYENSITYTAATPIILSVKNLNVKYFINKNIFGKGNRYYHAIRNISFDVHKAETLGIVGESGCGKTTLSRAILRLIEASGGEIIYNGKSIYSHEKRASLKRQMQIIFQDPYSSLNPSLTIGQAICEPLQIHGIFSTERQRKNVAIKWLERVQLNAEYYDYYPHQLSGGQRQRAVIARALAIQPDLLICDECVSALDISIQIQILNLLIDLKREIGFTILFISHDLEVVKYMSDRIMVMRNGIIEEIGTTNQIYFHPQSTYTRQLLDAIPKGIR